MQSCGLAGVEVECSAEARVAMELQCHSQSPPQTSGLIGFEPVSFEISVRITQQVVRSNSAATESRSATDGSILALDDRARRDQHIAQPVMISLEMMMGDILTQRTMQHPLPDRNHLR